MAKAESAKLAIEGNQTNIRDRFCMEPLMKEKAIDVQISYFLFIFFLYKTSHLNKEVKHAEPTPLVSVPWIL